MAISPSDGTKTYAWNALNQLAEVKTAQKAQILLPAVACPVVPFDHIHPLQVVEPVAGKRSPFEY
jgi:hypothetical protein